MAPNIYIISAYLFVVLPNLQAILAAEAEDLVDEYYTTTPTTTDQFTDQDSKDDQEIMDNGTEEVFASILLYREKIRRYAINQKITDHFLIGRFPFLVDERPIWITQRYIPQSNSNHRHTPFMDLLFGLVEDENVVLSAYLHNFFDYKQTKWIVIAMVLTKDMESMKKAYDHDFINGNFKNDRENQDGPFENMLRVWAEKNREQIEVDKLDDTLVTSDAIILQMEHDNGCWLEDRSQLELITMKKSIKYARAVIQKFEVALNEKKTIDYIIMDCKDTNGLDEDLANTYSSLALYIKDKYNYIATTLHDNSEKSNWWAAWIMCIAVVHPQEWPKVDAAFQKLYKAEANSLSDFILKKLVTDKVMAEAIAVVVDPKFIPTTFKEIPVQDDPGKPPATPPPAPPTTPAPAS